MKTSNHTPQFESIFANYLKNFLLFKISLGYKYKSERNILARFDKFCKTEDVNTLELTENIILKWASKRASESHKTHSIRNTVLRQFCIYLNNNGIPVILSAQIKKNKCLKVFKPYIFTYEQISNLIFQADKMGEERSSSISYVVIPVILRILYGCGLRVSEVLALKISDIDLKHGIITVKDSKFGNSRLVPISKSLKTVLIDYFKNVHSVSEDKDIVFPTSKNTQYNTAAIYLKFRELLWQCKISHGGRGKGPRVHDLRHTFAVHTLQKWIKKNQDTFLLLPILSVYLGHKNIYSTEKYLRLTSEMYLDTLKKVKNICNNVIPEVIDYETY